MSSRKKQKDEYMPKSKGSFHQDCSSSKSRSPSPAAPSDSVALRKSRKHRQTSKNRGSTESPANEESIYRYKTRTLKAPMSSHDDRDIFGSIQSRSKSHEKSTPLVRNSAMLEKWATMELERVKPVVKRSEADQHWTKEESDKASTSDSGRTYSVLSYEVRHELNKYFFDVNQKPSKSERQKLLYRIWHTDPSVSMSKVVRWFQNKRQYCKTHGQGSLATPPDPSHVCASSSESEDEMGSRSRHRSSSSHLRSGSDSE